MEVGKYVKFIEPIGQFDGSNKEFFAGSLPDKCKIEKDILLYLDVGLWVPMPIGAIAMKDGTIFIYPEEFFSDYVKIG